MSKVIKVGITAADTQGFPVLDGVSVMADISEQIPRNQAIPAGFKFINLRFAVPHAQAEDFQSALNTGTAELVIEGVASGVERAFAAHV
jgi:hypothetical protein